VCEATVALGAPNVAAVPDPSVIAAIEAAVDAQPGNVALRCHLVELLTDAGRHDDAWQHAEHAVRLAPDDLDALRAAITAGRAADRPVAAYERILAALDAPSEQTASPLPPPVVAQPVGVTGNSIPDTIDELVAEWSQVDPAAEPEIGSFGRPAVTLADVGGMAHVKQQIERSFLAPLRNPELQAAFGKRAGGGLVLWGPPGCGKTFIARALAGEMGTAFYEVGLSQVLDMWLGNSERNLAGIFDYARRNAPCVVFFDELDALGQRRSQLRGGAMRTVVNELLAQMDGAGESNDGIYFLAATNHPWDVDAALMRPGRFDRKLLVLPPDAPARQAILDVHLRARPTVGVRLDKLAAATDGLSGADLKLVCDEAVEAALARSIERGAVQPVEHADLAAAAKRVRPSIGQWLDVAKNYAMFSNEGGEYDELLAYVSGRRR
jgi:SpoVK/Ycf46/Vps4 family AAA+-type ATPase